MKRRKVYDKVWVMSSNRPREMMIFSVMECMNFDKQGTDVYYNVVEGTFGSGLGNNEGRRLPETSLFDTKEDLLETL